MLFIWYDSMAFKSYRANHQTVSIAAKTNLYFEPSLLSPSNDNEPAKTRPVLKDNIFKVLLKLYCPIRTIVRIGLLDAFLIFMVSDEPIWKGFVIASLIFATFNRFFTTCFKKCQSQIMKEKNVRCKMISEILNGMKVLKLYAWKGAFGEIVASIRRKEIKNLIFQFIWLALIFFALGCGPFLVSFNLKHWLRPKRAIAKFK
uniref:ABC transmembrane type-1 domain-containing protein n=1 Tax=Tetranychus urticae TaxID=32264 RepID=T1L5V4_TETUR